MESARENVEGVSTTNESIPPDNQRVRVTVNTANTPPVVEEAEDDYVEPTLQETVVREVVKTLKETLPNLLEQMKDEIKVYVQEQIDAVTVARKTIETPVNQGVQQHTRVVTYRDFSACKPPTFDGTPDPLVSTTWVSEVEGAFRTSYCPPESKVIFASNLLRGAAKDWWNLLLKKEGVEARSSLAFAR